MVSLSSFFGSVRGVWLVGCVIGWFGTQLTWALSLGQEAGEQAALREHAKREHGQDEQGGFDVHGFSLFFLVGD